VVIRNLFITVRIVAVALSSLVTNDQRARVLLQAGEAQEKIERDLHAAINVLRQSC
jgi:hypothetical protein